MLKNFMKKGQISIFIVISIIIIVLSIFMINMFDVEIFMSADTKLKNQVSDVVKECLDDSVSRGVFLLGFQGGKLEIGPEILNNPKKYTDLGLKIPVWDSITGGIPSIDSMNVELNNFVLSDAKSCIGVNLKSFENYLDINYTGDFILDTKINPESVVVELNFPISFKEKNSDEVLVVEDFFVEVESLRLGDMFSLAKQIYSVESSEEFLENLVIDQIMSANDYSDPKYSMPSEGMSITCAPKIWLVDTLKKNLANLNNNNFKYLYFDGTYSKENLYNSNFNEDIGTKNLENYFLSHYVFYLDDKKRSYSNYNVEFFMPSSEVTGADGYLQSYPYREFKVTPSEGGVVKSIDMKVGADAKLPIPCIQVYHHLYTLDYDLIVRITDMNDDGDGFQFQFPLRILIENNEPKVSRGAPVIERDFGGISSATYCADDKAMYPLDVYVKDELTGDYLSNVNISYTCLTYSCDMGSTSKPKFNGITRIYSDPYYTGNFPFCYNGYVSAEKEGYHNSKFMVQTDSSLIKDDGTNSYIELSIRAKKKFEVLPGSFLLINKETKQSEVDIYSKNATFLVTVSNKDLGFESFAFYSSEMDLDSISEYNKLELLEGTETYSVSALYVENGQLRGIYEKDNVVINSNLGNEFKVTIPGSINVINQDNYLEFFEYMEDVVEVSDSYGLNIVS